MQLHKPNFLVEIKATCHDRHGTLVNSYPWVPANSLLKQFIQILVCQMSQAAISVLDKTNTLRSISPNLSNLQCSIAAGFSTQGILIGTGTTAVTMADYKLETQVSANIYHRAPTFAVENPDSSTWRAALARGFDNNTGSTLNVTEVALYSYYNMGYQFCIDRTLYSVAVATGETLTLTYRITVTL